LCRLTLTRPAHTLGLETGCAYIKRGGRLLALEQLKEKRQTAIIKSGTLEVRRQATEHKFWGKRQAAGTNKMKQYRFKYHPPAKKDLDIQGARQFEGSAVGFLAVEKKTPSTRQINYFCRGTNATARRFMCQKTARGESQTCRYLR